MSHIVEFHLHEMFRVGRPIEEENRLVIVNILKNYWIV